MAFDRTELGDGAFIDYDPAWLAPERATALMHALIDAYDWAQRPINLFGKEVMQPRLIAWSGTLPYKYSGQVLDPRPFADPLSEVTRAVSAVVGVEFNHVLLNRYRDGNDSMGMHADDEPELGRDPIIAGISMGAPRRFVVLRKKKGASTHRDVGDRAVPLDRFSLTLEHGSLLVMGGTMQHQFRHGVPKTSADRSRGAPLRSGFPLRSLNSISDQRINVTFRRLLRPPPGASFAGDASSSASAPPG